MTATVVTAPPVDLSLTNTGAPNPVTSGQHLTYTLHPPWGSAQASWLPGPGATLFKTGERRHRSAGGDRPCHDGSVLAYPEQQ